MIVQDMVMVIGMKAHGVSAITMTAFTAITTATTLTKMVGDMVTETSVSGSALTFNLYSLNVR